MLTLAAKLEGPFVSYFAAEGRRAPAGRAVKAEGDPAARLFVVGSSRWVDDRFLQMFPQNLLLFENALDAFAMGDALIGIRSRASLSRPIAELSDASRAALKYLNIAIGPLLLAAIGITVAVARRMRISRIMSRYQQ